MSRKFDVVVIGAGPAGYVAAIRCAQLGLNTACVDRWQDNDSKASPGGTCLNVGCIPSKALLESSEQFYRLQHDYAAHGINVKDADVDIATMQARKENVVRNLTRGVASLFKANGVTSILGHGRLLTGLRVAVTPPGAKEPDTVLEAGSVILASGSRPSQLDAAPCDNDRIVNSDGALALNEIPPRLGIVGAGYIGLELGSVWRRLGSEVMLLEAMDTFLPTVDDQLAKAALSQFKEQGLDIRLGTRVLGCQVLDDGVHVRFSTRDSDEQTLVFDKLVVAVGRTPVTDNLFAPEADLLLDERGYIDIDDDFQTNLPGVYAIGDVVRGPMLAHKGSEEGVAVAERIAGGAAQVNYETIPSIIYTAPEVAWVGRNERQLKEAGESYRRGVFPFAANGRAQAAGQTAGMIKILADAQSDRILGVHILGAHGSELIAEAVLAMEYEGSAEDLACTIHAHPTLAEAMHEAALAVGGRAIHRAS